MTGKLTFRDDNDGVVFSKGGKMLDQLNRTLIFANNDRLDVLNEAGTEAIFRADTLEQAPSFKGNYMFHAGNLGIGARLTHTLTQSIPNNSHTPLNFDTARYASAGIYNAADNTKLTIPQDGKYLIIGNLAWVGNSNQGTSGLGIRLNGGSLLAFERAIGSSAYPTSMTVVTLYSLLSGNYIELTAFQDSGVSLSTLRETYYTPEFMMIKVG